MRGRYGGLRLHARAGTVTVGEVVRATGNDFRLVGRFPGARGAHAHCDIAPQCRLKGVLERARDAWLAEPGQHTVGELAQPAGPLAALPGIRLAPSRANRTGGVTRGRATRAARVRAATAELSPGRAKSA